MEVKIGVIVCTSLEIAIAHIGKSVEASVGAGSLLKWEWVVLTWDVVSKCEWQLVTAETFYLSPPRILRSKVGRPTV